MLEKSADSILKSLEEMYAKVIRQRQGYENLSSAWCSSVQIPSELEEVIQGIAFDGFVRYPWNFVKYLLSVKLRKILLTAPTLTPLRPDSSPSPSSSSSSSSMIRNPGSSGSAVGGAININEGMLDDHESFPLYVRNLESLLEAFSEPPFTTQRLCELLTSPERGYTTTQKLSYAFEKLVTVVSTIPSTVPDDMSVSATAPPPLSASSRSNPLVEDTVRVATRKRKTPPAVLGDAVPLTATTPPSHRHSIDLKAEKSLLSHSCTQEHYSLLDDEKGARKDKRSGQPRTSAPASVVDAPTINSSGSGKVVVTTGDSLSGNHSFIDNNSQRENG